MLTFVRRPTKAIFKTVALVAASFAIAGHPAPAAERPNVLLIVVDDLGYGELGCQGNREIPTPHIDSLAARGVRFTSGYVTASYCSPSRAGLLTGRYQTRFGHELNPVGKANLDPSAGLPLVEKTLANQLKAAGYATALVGKWHLGGTEAHHPLRRGFDEFYGFLHEGHFYVPPPYEGVTSFLRKRLPADEPLRIEGKTIWNGRLGRDEPPYDADNPLMRGTRAIREDAYLTDALDREAVAFIERHKQQPFFLYLPYNAVHSPMQASDAYLERFKHIDDVHRRVFAAMLSNLDDSVGRVLDALRRHGLDERTLIFFLSDNGGIPAELTSSNGPLRGGKGSTYEGGLRVPFVVQWRGRVPEGKVEHRPVCSLDVFATAAAAAGASTPAGRTLDGVDLLPYLCGERRQAPHPVLYWRMGDRAALRKDDWKLVLKLKKDGRREAELYDLANDLGEQQDLASTQPQKLAELLAAWDALNAQMVEPVWPPK